MTDAFFRQWGLAIDELALSPSRLGVAHAAKRRSQRRSCLTRSTTRASGGRRGVARRPPPDAVEHDENGEIKA